MKPIFAFLVFFLGSAVIMAQVLKQYPFKLGYPLKVKQNAAQVITKKAHRAYCIATKAQNVIDYFKGNGESDAKHVITIAQWGVQKIITDITSVITYQRTIKTKKHVQ